VLFTHNTFCLCTIILLQCYFNCVFKEMQTSDASLFAFVLNVYLKFQVWLPFAIKTLQVFF